MKTFLIIIFCSIAVYAQSKQDSVKEQQARFAFQNQLNKVQQLEQQIEKEKAKFFDVWRDWQISLIPFQKDSVKPKEK